MYSLSTKVLICLQIISLDLRSLNAMDTIERDLFCYQIKEKPKKGFLKFS